MGKTKRRRKEEGMVSYAVKSKREIGNSATRKKGDRKKEDEEKEKDVEEKDEEKKNEKGEMKEGKD